MKFYIGLEYFRARPSKVDGANGFEIEYTDGATSWCPANAFNHLSVELPDVVEDADVMLEDIKEFIRAKYCK